MGLTKFERETIVNMNDGEDAAYIYTAQPKTLGRLRRNPAAVLVEEGYDGRTPWARFKIPARLISFRSVAARPEMSEERKQQARDQLARLNAARKAKNRLQAAQDAEEKDAQAVRVPH